MSSRLHGIDPRLYFITDLQMISQAGRSTLATVKAAVAGGAGVVQIRGKNLSDDEFYRLSRDVIGELRSIFSAKSSRVIPVVLNNRIEVAKRLLDGGYRVHVHLGQTDADPLEARRYLGRDSLIGVSVRCPQEIIEAEASGTVDWLGIGPVFHTRTKPDAGVGLGLARVAELANRSRLPAIAIGGIDRHRAKLLASTAVSGVAVISAICLADDPEAMARQIYSNFASR